MLEQTRSRDGDHHRRCAMALGVLKEIADHAAQQPRVAHDAHRFAVETNVDAAAHGLWKWETEAKPGEMPPPVRQVLDDEIRNGIAVMVTNRIFGGIVATRLASALASTFSSGRSRAVASAMVVRRTMRPSGSTSST